MKDHEIILTNGETNNHTLQFSLPGDVLKKPKCRRSSSFIANTNLDKLFNLRIVSCPRKPVHTGKNRHKFPNPRKDCFVQVSVGDLHTINGFKESLIPYNIDYTNKTLSSSEHDVTFKVELSSVRRVCDGSGIFLDEKDSLSCLHCPLKAHRRTPKDGNDTCKFGFWFRFFDENTRFVITIDLKLEIRGRAAVRTGFKTGSHVLSSAEFEIVTRERRKPCSDNNSTKTEGECIKKSKSKSLKGYPVPPLLKQSGYQEVISHLRNLVDFCQWESFDSVCEKHIQTFRNTDPELTAAILLEKSVAACWQGKFDQAKCILKSSLELVNKRKSKDLLSGRAYLYLSLVHSAEKNFGNAEECLFIAAQHLSRLGNCEDWGLLQYLKALVIVEFIPKMPRGLVHLKKEANERLQKALKCWNAEGKLNQVKFIGSHNLALASMSLCELNIFGYSKILMENARTNLDTVEKLYDSLPVRTRCEYLLKRSDLLSYEGATQDCIKCIEESVVIAKSNQLPIEIKQAQDKLDRVRGQLEDSTSCDASELKNNTVSDTKLSLADGYNGDLSSELDD